MSIDSEGSDVDQTGTLTDPVCGMTMDRSNAQVSVEYQGATYYFCSETCLRQFKSAPHKYMHSPPVPESNATAQAASVKGTLYTCPMHPEIRQEGPGDCPKCGMALEPQLPDAPLSNTEWTCPMHPEVIRDEPGACPKCGMALEPRTVAAGEEEN
jgi:P-type Cu+ transporter